MKYIKGLLLALCLLICLGLWGCDNTDSPKETTQQLEYKVQFFVGGQVENSQTVLEGQKPKAFSKEIAGMEFAYWQDKFGNIITPEKFPVSSDMDYFAVYYPILNVHAPYLFLDEKGNLNPNETISAEAVDAAIAAIATEEAKTHLPFFSTEAETASSRELWLFLERLFPRETLEKGSALAKGETVTRAEFAQLMNILTGRNTEEKVEIETDAVMPGDVEKEDEYFLALMEASVPHKHEENGKTWEEVAQQLQLEPGYMHIDGYLYYVDENRQMVKGKTVKGLTFGDDGRYTSGDKDLDKTVADILKKIIEENPKAKRLDLLRKAFEYCRDSFTYRRRYDPYDIGETGWEIEEAKAMFETTKGNCYSFASTFWALARGLGYDAKAISGTMLKDRQPHGWVEIEMDGKPYIFDPEMEYVYVHERQDYSHDMFMVTYSAGAWWNYRRAK